MAIKIKKKNSEPEQNEEEVLEAEGNVTLPEGGGDRFQDATLRTAAWIEDNRNVVIGGLVATIVVVVGVFVGLQFMEKQQVEASSVLSEGLAAYEVLVEGSPDLKALQQNPELDAPSETFPSEEAKWQKIYDQADKALQEHGSGDIGQAARLTKAAAAFHLGKTDEAIELYQAYLSGPKADETEAMARFGLANSLAAAGQADQAVAELDKLAELQPEQAGLVLYEKGRILQRNGKVEDAKKLYHEVLEKYPETAVRGDIERRLALL